MQVRGLMFKTDSFLQESGETKFHLLARNAILKVVQLLFYVDRIPTQAAHVAGGRAKPCSTKLFPCRSICWVLKQTVNAQCIVPSRFSRVLFKMFDEMRDERFWRVEPLETISTPKRMFGWEILHSIVEMIALSVSVTSMVLLMVVAEVISTMISLRAVGTVPQAD
jgi:hypothetical protein